MVIYFFIKRHDYYFLKLKIIKEFLVKFYVFSCLIKKG